MWDGDRSVLQRMEYIEKVGRTTEAGEGMSRASAGAEEAGTGPVEHTTHPQWDYVNSVKIVMASHSTNSII